MISANKRRVAALIFRGFDVLPEQIEEMLGVRASEVGRRGDHVKPGVKAVLNRSFARFSVELDSTSRLDQAIPALLQHAGGIEAVVKVRDALEPEFFEIGITWPVKFSEEQEGGFLSVAVISDLARLRCNLTFGFI